MKQTAELKSGSIKAWKLLKRYSNILFYKGIILKIKGLSLSCNIESLLLNP
jgi:hypothetical protein